MVSLPRVRLGVPIRQAVEVGDGLSRDCFYAIKLMTTNLDDSSTLYKNSYHLITVKELSEAINRYYADADICIDHQSRTMLGYAHPLTYSNRNGVLTTRIFVRLDCSEVDEFTDRICCCLFSPREIRRSKERYDEFILHNRSFFIRLWKGVKKCLGL